MTKFDQGLLRYSTSTSKHFDFGLVHTAVVFVLIIFASALTKSGRALYCDFSPSSSPSNLGPNATTTATKTMPVKTNRIKINQNQINQNQNQTDQNQANKKQTKLKQDQPKQN